MVWPNSSVEVLDVFKDPLV
jgi:hypothetical protein